MFFDSASRQVCSVKPPRTNSPLHALATLNDVTYVEAARALAERALTEAGPTVDERIERAFQLVLARKPASGEKDVLRSSLERLAREFASDPIAAKEFLSIGASARNEKIEAVEHAAYAGLCAAILNLDEALTKE